MGCHRVALYWCSVLASGIACVLLIAALAKRDWLSDKQTLTGTTDFGGVPRNASMNIDVGVDMFMTRWNIIVNPPAPQPSQVAANYDGKIQDICSDPGVKKLIDLTGVDLCQYISAAGQGIGAIAIISVVSQGLAVVLLIITIMGKSCDNRCCTCLLAFAIFIAWLSVLIVAAGWGGIAIYGKDQLNQQLPAFFASFVQGGVTLDPGQTGQFTASTSLWVAVAAVGPAFLSMIFNFAACCCGDRRDNKLRGADPKSVV